MKVIAPIAALAVVVAAFVHGSAARAETAGLDRYLVLIADSQPATAGYQLSTADRQAALARVAAVGGTVVDDMSETIGVLVVSSSLTSFAESLATSSLFESVGADFAFPLNQPTNPNPEPHADPLEVTQWNMAMIRTQQAHAVQTGNRQVEVGILDSGIDGNHVDFDDDGIPGGTKNVDCARGRNSVNAIVGLPGEGGIGPGVGTPDPCTDNQFHGTHVAGIVAAQANGLGVVGVAPNVTLIPVKVCDTTGFCYASAVVDGINYAGQQKFEVINMSFFVDDNSIQDSTRKKCMDDPLQRTFRLAVERAIQFARNQGVTPVAALGNEQDDLAHQQDDADTSGKNDANECEEVPAETQGVIGVSALTMASELATYSNYGDFAVDVSAPGGGASNCASGIVSTIPFLTGYGCFAGTSMASPHAAGVAALIVAHYGQFNSSTGDWEMRPQQVEQYLQSSTIDIGLSGYDECYGNGRVDALKAVGHDTSRVYEPHNCLRYAQQP